MKQKIIEKIYKNGQNLNISVLNLESNLLTASISTLGATLTDLKFKNEKNSLILKYNNNNDYFFDNHYIGCTIGRFANRLKGSNLILKKKNNFNNEDILLHSGKNGFNYKNWKILNFSSDFVFLGLLDEEKKNFLPGNLYVNSLFKLIDNKLIIIYFGRTDKTTLCNITNHSYFSLDDSCSINNHEIEIFTDKFLPTNKLFLPTGNIENVKNTKFDFTSLKKLKNLSIDNNYCFENTKKIKKLAYVKSNISKNSLTLFSTSTGVQFYTGDNLYEKKLNNRVIGFKPKSGLCLEPQSWPNSPNINNFPKAILYPEKYFFQMNIFCFSKITF